MRAMRFHAGQRGNPCGAALALAVMVFFSGMAPPAHAADDDGPAFDITVEGEEIAEDSGHYKGPVTLALSAGKSAEATSLWVNDNGIWKMVPAPADGATYRMTFSKNGPYDIEFRAEDKKTLKYTLDNAEFYVDAPLWDVVQKIDALPDSDGATDEQVTAAKAEIASLSNTLNALRASQRAVAEDQVGKLSALRDRLVTLDPGTDYEAPPEPEYEIQGESDAEESVYISADIEITVAADGDLASVLVDRGDGWTPLEKNGAAKYVLSLKDAGKSHIELSAQDTAGNRSPSVGVDITVDPDIPALVDEVARLYKNAQSISQDEYISSLEKVYLQYMELAPYRQALVPALTLAHLNSMYSYILEQIKFENTATGDDGRFIEAVGMYRSLKVPALHLSSNATSLEAERLAEPGAAPDGLKGEVLAEYRIAFQCPKMQDGDLALDAEYPIRVALQIPDDLIGKKDVDMVYVDGSGVATALNARVRSTADGLVMYFNTTQTGRFLFVSGTAPAGSGA